MQTAVMVLVGYVLAGIARAVVAIVVGWFFAGWFFRLDKIVRLLEQIATQPRVESKPADTSSIPEAKLWTEKT